jgi:hypothetical protein
MQISGLQEPRHVERNGTAAVYGNNRGRNNDEQGGLRVEPLPAVGDHPDDEISTRREHLQNLDQNNRERFELVGSRDQNEVFALLDLPEPRVQRGAVQRAPVVHFRGHQSLPLDQVSSPFVRLEGQEGTLDLHPPVPHIVLLRRAADPAEGARSLLRVDLLAVEILPVLLQQPPHGPQTEHPGLVHDDGQSLRRRDHLGCHRLSADVHIDPHFRREEGTGLLGHDKVADGVGGARSSRLQETHGGTVPHKHARSVQRQNLHGVRQVQRLEPGDGAARGRRSFGQEHDLRLPV